VNNSNKVAIIILTYNNLEYNKKCLESIRKYTESGSYEIVVIDNNSTDGTKEWLETQTDIKLQLNDYNAGFPKGCNIGISLASKECDIMLLNNDTMVTPRWLENLRICLYSDEKIGAVGAICNHNENLQGADFHYNNLYEMLPLAEKNNISDSHRWEEKIFLIGFCILIKRQVMDIVMELDEGYSPGYVEDNDLSIRIIKAGYKLMLCHDCFIHHYLGSEFRKNLNRFYPVLYANREKFKNKWGFETYLFDEIEFASLRILDEPDKQKRINVLHIGCGIGVSLLKVKKEYPNASLYGVEEDKNIAEIAKQIAQVSITPISDFSFDLPEEYFDFILIGSQLEKVENPENFLTGLKKHLKTGGYIIGTVQNIMHYSIIRKLLSGSWLYSQNNMLNKSNHTFFALNDISRIFSNCGYRSQYVFHWFSSMSEEDKLFVRELCEVGDEKRDYIYNTYLFSFRFQK
jgi:GT2 family glycosyltransferase